MKIKKIKFLCCALIISLSFYGSFSDFNVNAEGKNIYKILLTGGPCAGKTTSLPILKEHFERLNYNVIIIPEILSEIIPKYFSEGLNADNFERYMRIGYLEQSRLENEAYEKASSMSDKKTIILCDRTPIELKSYEGFKNLVTEENYKRVIDELAINEEEYKSHYDLVICIESIAVNFPEYYTLMNNKARGFNKNIPMVVRTDKAIHDYWKSVENFVFVSTGITSSDYKDKITIILNEIHMFIEKH